MYLISTIMGWVFTAALFLHGFVWFLSVRVERKLVDGETARQQGFKDCLTKLMSDSWWFSEDEQTMNVVQGLAQGKCVSAVRDEWQAARKKEIM